MPLEWYVAIRFLREGRMQTLLIVAGAAIGVAVMLFLSALMGGLAESLIAQTLGTQAHIVVRPVVEAARPQRTSTRDTLVMPRVERTAQRVRSIVGWQQVMREVERAPGVVSVSPTVSGPVFAQRGDASKSVILLGIDPERFARIYPIRARLREGVYRPVGDSCVIGTELASDLGVSVGDKVRLSVVDGASDVFTVAGLFDLGNREVNRRWVLVSMRSAQTLLDAIGQLAGNKYDGFHGAILRQSSVIGESIRQVIRLRQTDPGGQYRVSSSIRSGVVARGAARYRSFLPSGVRNP